MILDYDLMIEVRKEKEKVEDPKNILVDEEYLKRCYKSGFVYRHHILGLKIKWDNYTRGFRVVK